LQPCAKRFLANSCKVAIGFRIYRENMNITDLPEGPYTIACYNRRNRIVLNGSCAHASAAAVQARVTAPNKTYWIVTAKHEVSGDQYWFHVNREPRRRARRNRTSRIGNWLAA
jgi:hypothetical protein